MMQCSPEMVYISFPSEYGTLYTRRELEEIKGICESFSLPLMIDGARLGYGLTSPACELTLPDIARLCDVFYIGGAARPWSSPVAMRRNISIRSPNSTGP